jgi:general stress protein 26
MTAQFEDESGTLWFFSSKDNLLVQQLQTRHVAVAAFVSKDHSLFASIKGELMIDNDPEMIDRLWNDFLAAWYTGKDDPKLVLLRLDARSVEIWRSEHSLLTGIKILLGLDVKDDLRDDVAHVDLLRRSG